MSSAVAGVVPGLDGLFGTFDDARIFSASDQAGIVSRIASVTIGGAVLGTAAPGDNFGIVAQQISGLKVGGATVNVPALGVILILPAATNDVTALQVI